MTAKQLEDTQAAALLVRTTYTQFQKAVQRLLTGSLGWRREFVGEGDLALNVILLMERGAVSVGSAAYEVSALARDIITECQKRSPNGEGA